jgi:hypothetical protein
MGWLVDSERTDERVIPSFRVFDCSVVRLKPSFAAARAGPPTIPFDSPNARSAASCGWLWPFKDLAS